MIQVIMGETMAHRARMTDIEIVKSMLGISDPLKYISAWKR